MDRLVDKVCYQKSKSDKDDDLSSDGFYNRHGILLRMVVYVCLIVCPSLSYHICSIRNIKLCIRITLILLPTRIHGPSFVRARYCSVKVGLWIRHVHLCCEVPDMLNEFESCSSRLFR